MHIEQLNKSQIVLLTLLVSFVTSIATGIVTVSLMEQAPPVIPQTINRVVERTVERVVPKETQTATVITTEKTVVVKETDLIAQAVSRVRPSSIRLFTKGADALGDFLSRGVVLSDGYAVANIGETAVNTVYLVPGAEKSIEAKVLKVDAKNALALLVLAEPEKERTPAAVMSTDMIILGQTVIAISGNPAVKVASGIVTAVNEAKSESGEAIQTSFETNIAPEVLVPGSVLVNTDGAVIGLFVGEAKIVPVSVLGNLVSSVIKPADTRATDAKDVKKSQ